MSTVTALRLGRMLGPCSLAAISRVALPPDTFRAGAGGFALVEAPNVLARHSYDATDSHRNNNDHLCAAGPSMTGWNEQIVKFAIGTVKGWIEPTPAERAAAYELFIELGSRTTTAPLSEDEGLIREALTSLYVMFDLTRTILRTHGCDTAKGRGDGNITLAVIALRVLNEIIRPRTSKWHPRLKQWEDQRSLQSAPIPNAVEWEHDWIEARECRSDLNRMRGLIRAYMDTLAKIAGAPALAEVVVPSPPALPIQPVRIDAPVTAPPGADPRANMVRWFDPIEGFQTMRAKRTNAPKESAVDHPADLSEVPTVGYASGGDGPFWIDYVSDLGDAFDPTAAVAWQLTRPSITLPIDRAGEFPKPPGRLPRGRLMVLGGDGAYPFATSDRYTQQLELPYRLAAASQPDGGTSPTPADSDVLAIPGNHDWYGGIGLFEKVFAGASTFADGWTAPQTEMWWAVQMPHGWWLWGIDTGLDDQIDQRQVGYFERAAELLNEGDQVILCSPVPFWQLRQKREKCYYLLRAELDRLIVSRKATMPLFLAGDSHFFAHYERVDLAKDEDHITAGGGGAFLQPTHNLPEQIPYEKGAPEFRLTQRWPRPVDSRALAPGIGAIRDRQFWLIFGLAAGLHTAYAGLSSIRWGALVAGSRPQGEWKHVARWVIGGWPGWLVPAVLAGGILLSVAPNSRESQLKSGTTKYGLIHAVAQAALLVAAATAARSLGPQHGWWRLLVVPLVAGVVSTAAFVGISRWINGQIRANDTLSFASGHLTRYKQFLRMCVDTDGALTVYAIGLDPVGKGWFEALTTRGSWVPPYDPAGTPRLHYVWGKRFEPSKHPTSDPTTEEVPR